MRQPMASIQVSGRPKQQQNNDHRCRVGCLYRPRLDGGRRPARPHSIPLCGFATARFRRAVADSKPTNSTRRDNRHYRGYVVFSLNISAEHAVMYRSL
jgi:hypothetical protein